MPRRLDASLKPLAILTAIVAIALVGLYAVVSYQVTRRTREIGIRMALGAEQLQVVRIFLKQGIVMSSIGISMGLVLSVFASRAVASNLGTPAPYPSRQICSQ